MRKIKFTASPLSSFETGTYILPDSARLLSSGVSYERTLERAVEAETWIVVGDGKPKPAPLNIGMELNADTPEALRLLENAIRNAANTATAVLMRDADGTVMRRDVTAVLEQPASIQRAATQLILQISFAPVRAWWTRQNGTEQFTF
jgi:hypothetical protein